MSTEKIPNLPTSLGSFVNMPKGEIRKRQREAIRWYLDKIDLDKKTIEPEDMFKGKRNVNVPLVGQLLFFKYDAKHKDTLPYWDRYPLAMIIDIREDSFLSLNLHYLDYASRNLLIFYLLKTIHRNNPNRDGRAAARINYMLTKTLSQYHFIKPAIKQHNFDRIRSKIIRVPVQEWPHAIFLPLQRFQKASYQKVLADSWQKIHKDYYAVNRSPVR